VINKADRDGVNATEKELQALLSLAMREDEWQPPIVKTVATENQGVQDLAAAIEKYREFYLKTRLADGRRKAVARWRILELLRERLVSQTLESNSASENLDRLAGEVASRQRDPYSAVEEILGRTAVGHDSASNES
jgi:LAO/AO transport system kinase